MRKKDDTIFRQEEAREYLGVSRTKLDSFIFSGILPAEKNGVFWEVRKSDIDKLIAKCHDCPRIRPVSEFEKLAEKDKDGKAIYVCKVCYRKRTKVPQKRGRKSKKAAA